MTLIFKNYILVKSYSTSIIIRYKDKVYRKQGKLHKTPGITIYYAQQYGFGIVGQHAAKHISNNVIIYRFKQ